MSEEFDTTCFYLKIIYPDNPIGQGGKFTYLYLTTYGSPFSTEPKTLFTIKKETYGYILCALDDNYKSKHVGFTFGGKPTLTEESSIREISPYSRSDDTRLRIYNKQQAIFTQCSYLSSCLVFVEFPPPLKPLLK